MALVETDAMVLRSYNLAEADRIIVMFTREAGLIRGVARGARRLKSKFSGALEPFTLLAISYSEKEGRELVNLQGADIKESIFNRSGDPDVASSLAHIASLMLQFAPPHEPNEKLFRLLSAVSHCFYSMSISPEGLVRYFEFWLLRLSGFLADLKVCATCRGSIYEFGRASFDNEFRLHCFNCSGGKGVNLQGDGLQILLNVFNLSPENFVKRFGTLNRGAREELGSISKRMIERVLEHETRVLH
jgi:DNA repair protein RecO (recombination protein O)